MSKVPLRRLLDEVERRTPGHRVRVRLGVPHRYCDDCAHFRHERSMCSLGHEMRFRDPADMGEAVAGDWGYYRRGCQDRTQPEG